MPELASTFSALADPTRLAMVRLLAHEPLRSSVIAESLSVSRAVASRHLRILHRAGIVVEQPVPDDARGRNYALQAAPLRDVRGFLDEVEAYWRDQLEAFRAFAEGDES